MSTVASSLRLDRHGRQTLALLVGWLAMMIGLTWGVGPEPGWLANWMRWDGIWYRSIWENGYAAQPHTIAFPPLYPLLVGSLSAITRVGFGAVAIGVNLIALFLACLSLRRIYERRFGLPVFWPTVFLFCFPALYFVLAPYTDTLFLCVFLRIIVLVSEPWSQLLRREKGELLVLMLCAPLIRVPGVIFAGLLLFGRWQALASVAGVAIWLMVNHAVAGNPFAFMAVQSDFLMVDGGPLRGLIGATVGLFFGFSPGDWLRWSQYHLLPILILGLFAITAIWLTRRRDWLLLYFLLSILLISHSQPFWRSVVRYDMPLWPFLAAPWLSLLGSDMPGRADLRPHRIALLWGALGTVAAMGFALQMVYARVFVSRGWAF